MTFVHSCGNLGLLLSGYMLDHRCDRRGVIEMGEPVLPWAVRFHRRLYILPQIAEAFPVVSPGALVVPIAKHPLHGVGTRTVRWEPEQLTRWRTGDPLLDSFGFMNTGGIHDDVEARHCGRWIRGGQQRQEVTKYPRCFSGDRDNTASCQSPDAAPQRENVSRSCPASYSRPACLAASTRHRPAVGGG
jgi:hypothetical protein